MSKYLHVLFGLIVAATLTGCGAAPEDDLRQWMAVQKSETHPKIKPITEPKVFKPELYTMVSDVEPFSNVKLTQSLKKDSTQAASNGALIAPELARRKEPLEEFPMDGMALVGSMVKAGKPVALVTVGKLLYQVRVGDHLGQNFGRVTKISETEVSLREIVQDAAGEWIERTASLQLQERSK
ncbi:MAG: pilus assembly protein PilP [Rhodoferax sp.]|uniref:pilus assembly protein PilP n=1 Tax=Rhodoferax sp. TaxID=50421 RepID=UPI00263A31F6|nr:pilus assembly protein PilP [Rhodoferax sp.]MDD2879508.1 pilus assembly protein PilP [Rhodoferax sp.]